MFAEEKAAAVPSLLEGISSIIQSLLSNFLSVPIIILVLAIIFRRQIIDLLDKLIHRFTEKNLSEFELGTSGVKLKFDTSLGNTQVSVPKIKIDSKDFNLTTYTDGQYRFRISWDERTYVGSSEEGLQLEKILGQSPFPFVIKRRKAFADVETNVNIFVEVIDVNMTIEQYIHKTTVTMKQLNYEIRHSFVDENTNSGFVEYNVGETNMQFQKFVIQNGLAYIITATGSPKSDGLSKQILNNSPLKAELRNILNSFELVYTKNKDG